MEKHNILFVCTANICRSTTAEYLARDRFGQDRFRFASAGFMEDGRSSSDDLHKVMGKRSIDVSPHRSHRLTAQILTDADLALTMESKHMQNIAIEFGDYFDKCVPLREAAERLEGRSITVPQFVSELESRDPMNYLGKEWDVKDPYGRGIRAYKKMVPEVEELVITVLTALGG